MALPQPISRIQSIEDSGLQVIKGAKDARNVASAAPRMLRTGFQLAAEDISIGASSEEAAVIVDVAGGAVDCSVFVFICICYAVLSLLYWLWEVLRGIARQMPLGQGGRSVALVDMLFKGVPQLYTLLNQILAEQIALIFPAVIKIVTWAITHAFPGIKSPVDAHIEALIEPVHREADHLWGWVQQLSTEVTWLRQHVGGLPVPGQPVTGVSSNVQGAIADAIDPLARELRSQKGELDHLQSEVQTLAHNVATLQKQLYGARAANVGFQDVVSQIESMTDRIETMQSQQGAQLRSHASQLAHLAPLAGLMYLGERGLENLRRLENDPCQCPSLPGFPRLEPELLGVYEFLTNG